LPLAEHPNHAIRQQVAWALGQTQDKRCVTTLITLLEDEVESVQRLACDALEKIDDPDAQHSANEWRKYHPD